MPFLWPSKTGGFFYQQEDNPKSSSFADWPSEMTFPGNGVVRMTPNGATDFGIGKNISGFKDSIGGCDMDFKATQSRGYAYKQDDPRDVEYKWIGRFEDIDPDQGCSISFDTGHHGTPEPCCQGFAYMVNLRPASDPCEFRFRKEMWHVHYISKPFFSDSRVDFKLNGHGFIGFAGVRYNKPGAINTTVILEMWFNNDPINHPVDGWFRLATLEDKPGSGFGDGGDDCNGESDQVGTWSNVQNRTKTNSTSGFCEFKAITLREIDPTKSFDDTPPPPPDPDHNCPSGQVWNGTACVPIPDPGGGTPPPGGGTGIPTQISPVISYILINANPNGFPTFHPPMTGVQSMMLALSEDLAETMTDPNPARIDGEQGWRGVVGSGTAAEGEIGDLPCDHDFSADANLPLVHKFGDGLMVEPYWSNKDNGCNLSLPGSPPPDPGGGTPPPSGVVSAIIPFTTFSDVEDFADGAGMANDDYIALVFTEEVMECQTDTEFDGWSGPGVGDEDDGEIGEYCNQFDNGPGTVQTDIETYPDGISQEGYWSNRHSACVYPGLITTPLNSGSKIKYHGGRVQKNPVIKLIFWGSAWNTQSTPSRNAIVTRIRDKLLNPASASNAYWSELNQYSGCGSPTFGEFITYTDTEPPKLLDSDTDKQKRADMMWDSIATKFNTDWTALDNLQMVVFLPNGSFNADPGGVFDAYHTIDQFNFVFTSNNATIDDSAATDSTIDSNGIAWLEATGETLSWGMSRDDPDDFRWSHDTDNAGLGYETTWFTNCKNMTNSGHTAMKLGGGNHSGDCGGNDKQGFDTCCCWYDIGIRKNGDIQTQIEHPHNLNFDVDCDDCTMTNIGMDMNSGWIGLKHILYPENADGDVNHGGIRIKFYISTNAIGSNGLPTNDWKLVFNTLDTGQWLDDYEWPLYQELEMRLSGVNNTGDAKLYKDKVFARRWIRGAPPPGGGGPPPPQCPPGQVWNGLSCVSTGTGRITYHGGRVMKTPIVNLIFWGSGWTASTSATEKTFALPHYRGTLDSRPIIPVQMKLPNNQWSQEVLFNFDSGASQETYIPLELLSAFGYGPNGSESGTPQNITIRIPGFTGEYTISCKVQNKAHYDLQRSQPAPIRYPLIRLYDLLPSMSFVHSKDYFIIRTAATTIPELSVSGAITLPDMATRGGTPTSGKQWMHVDFVDPTNPSDTVDDWFGLNTGDQRIIVRKNVSDAITLTLNPPVDGDPDEHDAICNIRFKEATPSTLITNNTIVVRDETADFGSGGGPRNFGWGFQFLDKYTIIHHGASLHRVLIPAASTPAPPTGTASPLAVELISSVRDKLFNSDKAFFNNLNQYSGIQYPIFGQAVTNLTYPVPTATRISQQDATLVINNTIETNLLLQNADFNNTIYIVFMPIGHILYHPENNVEPDATHSSYKPTLTVSGSGSPGGGPDEPTDIEIIQFAFTLKSDINVNSGVTSCAGAAPAPPPPPPPDEPPEPPVDPPAGGGSSVFYKVSNTANEKALQDDSSQDHRTRIMQRITGSSSAMVGKKLIQADVPLRKESGTNDVTPLIYFKIWNSGNSAVYTSPTTFTPNELTTSFVSKSFDCSTNTRTFVVGDKCGIEFTGSDADEFIWTAYSTASGTGTGASHQQYKEGSSYDDQDSRNMSMTLWE